MTSTAEAVSAKDVGRVIGVLLPVQGALAYLVNFILLGPVMIPSPGFLVVAAGNALQVRLAVLLGLVNGAITVGIAIAAWPVFRRCSERMALWFLVLSAVSLTLLAVEDIATLSMLSLSQQYANASSTGLVDAAAMVIRSVRHWTHYTSLLVAGGAALALYGLLLRFALVPRALAACGLAAVLLQIVAVTMPIFGYRIVFALLVPLGLTQLTLSLWLMVRGFEPSAGRTGSTEAAAAS